MFRKMSIRFYLNIGVINVRYRYNIFRFASTTKRNTKFRIFLKKESIFVFHRRDDFLFFFSRGK